MTDEIFDFELEGLDGGSAVPELPHRPRPEPQPEAVVLATSAIVQDDVPSAPPGNGALASSVPISIPGPLSFRRGKAVDFSAAPDSDTFIPPHTLSLQTSLAESLPLSSSSRLRTRNKVFESMGYLATNTTQGFLVSRTGDHGAPPPPGATTSTVMSAFATAAGRSIGGSSRVFTPAHRNDVFDCQSEPSSTPVAIAGPHASREFARTSTCGPLGGLSIAAAIPERDDLESPSL